jgi:hypothetical protein
MPVDDVGIRMRILYAETRNLVADPVDSEGVARIRGALARLIAESESGIGFAPPLEPSIEDLAQPGLIVAWQACATAAASPAEPTTISGETAKIAFLATQDPQQDTAMRAQYPWLAKVPAPAAVGPAKQGAVGVSLFLMVAKEGAEPGRYPRGDQAPVVTRASAAKPGIIGPWTGALCFIAILALLIGAGWWTSSIAQHPNPSAADFAAAQAAATTAQMAADAAAKKAKEEPPAATAEEAKALQAKADEAKAALASMSQDLRAPWLITSLGLFALLVLISLGLRGEILGFLVDERGRMSLARFQFVAWTLVILGGYWVIALWNIGTAGLGDVLPKMQTDLWILLGVVTGSPLISALILDSKANAAPNTTAAVAAAAGSRDPAHVAGDAVGERGVLDIRTIAGNSSFLDLFTGEEVTNRASVDLSRVQQFVFTLVLILAYLSLLLIQLTSAEPGVRIASMPQLDATLIGLLALSHGAYLAAKAIPKTR